MQICKDIHVSIVEFTHSSTDSVTLLIHSLIQRTRHMWRHVSTHLFTHSVTASSHWIYSLNGSTHWVHSFINSFSDSFIHSSSEQICKDIHVRIVVHICILIDSKIKCPECLQHTKRAKQRTPIHCNTLQHTGRETGRVPRVSPFHRNRPPPKYLNLYLAFGSTHHHVFLLVSRYRSFSAKEPYSTGIGHHLIWILYFAVGSTSHHVLTNPHTLSLTNPQTHSLTNLHTFIFCSR